MLGSFFVSEKLSTAEIDRIAELSDAELKRIIEKGMEKAGSQIDLTVDEIQAMMDKMEKRIFAFFGQEDRTQTLALLVEYLGLTKYPVRQDAILNAIQAITLYREEEAYKAYLYSVKNEVYGIDYALDEV